MTPCVSAKSRNIRRAEAVWAGSIVLRPHVSSNSNAKELIEIMSHAASPRSLPTLMLVGAVLAAGTLGVFAPSVAHAGDEACTTKNFHYPTVEAACKEGGRKAAKAVMKAAVQKARPTNPDLKCTSCHEDVKDFKLKPNAVKDLKPWI